MSCYKLGDNCFVVCRFCAFTLEKRVDYHEHVHEDHFYCIKCKLGFSTIKGFRKHLACSSNHQFCCVTCHLDFTTSKALMQHFKSFLHLNNPGAVVKCPECGSIFNKPLGLAMHLERPGQRCAVQLHQQDLLTAIKLWEEYSGNCGLLTRSVENESPHQTLRSNVESLTELGTFATERSRARCTYSCPTYFNTWSRKTVAADRTKHRASTWKCMINFLLAPHLSFSRRFLCFTAWLASSRSSYF
ncbi:hypothetical protein O6H91_11G045000 [Diphasiastrum complanatum]|uniref:Uncharacterized protein n=1 Tax=Diphasiastrum complanatum TaxID=34168 RepID=A0ACC2C8L2_DIPCM|nr:hypothetical protein O6H91_11G045000 [Diphasiastrum complanatum]